MQPLFWLLQSKGIWNFAPVDLNVPDDVKIENVHLSESLMRLSFRMQNDSVKQTKRLA